MNDEQDIRDRLHAVDVPPSRLQADSLLPAGRRKAFRRRSAQAGTAVALATGVLLGVPAIVTRAGAAHDTPQVTAGRAAPNGTTPNRTTPQPSATETTKTVTCRTAIALKAPPEVKKVTVEGVDPTGRYVIGNGLVGQDFRPVLWTDGVAKALPAPAKSVQTTDVNSSGTVVGLYSNGTESSVFKYENGRFVPLRLPAGKWHPYPTPKINTAGDILINVEPSGNSGGDGSKVLLWKAGSTTTVELALPTGANGLDLNDDGTVVGSVYRNGVATFAYAWPRQGTGRKLAVPTGKAAAAYGVQGDWVTGGLWEPGSAALWNLRTGKVIDLGGSPAEQVNGEGWTVVDGTVTRADGTVTRLPVPGTDDDGTARAISDTGLVVGAGHGPSTWQC